MRDHARECTITENGNCTCANVQYQYWRSEMKALHEEVKGARFALFFMFVMWLITVGVLIWTK